MAADIRAGGALDLTVSGFAAFQAHGGALDDQRQDPDLSTGLDFSNDTEIHVLARAKDRATGIEYGGSIEFEADTNELENAGKSWVFVRGWLGEVRLGDEDGPVQESALGGFTVAAGTGGIDGDVVDVLAVDAVSPTDTDVATKVRYYTPEVDGFQLGVAYTPNADDRGTSLAPKDVEARDWFEGAIVYGGKLARAKVEASLVGSWGDVKDPEAFGGQGGRLWTWYGGGVAEFGDLQLGAGFGEEDVGGLEKCYLNLGVAYDLGEVSTSITGGRVLRARGYEGVGRPWNLVLSADTDLLPGLALEGDLAYVANDLDREAREPTGGDRGWVWVTRLELTF